MGEILSGFFVLIINKQNMTEKDKKLIEQARTMNCISYMDIYDLIEKADTEEAKSQ